MWEALLTQVKGVLGKTYVLAGLIPAAVLLLGWKVFRGGGLNFEQTVAGLMEKKAWAVASGGLLGLSLFWLGLLFFAGRGFFLHVLRNVPGSLLAPLRWHLINGQLSRRKRAELRRKDLQWKQTALSWHEADGGVWRKEDGGIKLPAGAQYIPEWSRIPAGLAAASDVLRASEEARARVSELALKADSLKIPPTRRLRKITEDFCRLYTFARQWPRDYVAYFEVSRWRELAARPDTKRVIELVRADNYRSWVESVFRSHAFPSEQWVAPTTLGNRFAALDDYAEKRYGITTSTLLKRLVGVIPKEERQEIADAQLGVEVLVNLCVASAALCVAVLISTTPGTLRALASGSWVTDRHAVLFIVASLVMTAASHYGAVYASGALAESVTRLVDLHRLQVIRAMGLKSPRTSGEEWETFKALGKLFVDGKRLPADRPLETVRQSGDGSPSNNGQPRAGGTGPPIRPAATEVVTLPAESETA